MIGDIRTSQITSWLFGVVVFAIGVLNIFLVHPVPGVVYLFLSLVYFLPINDILKKSFGFSILLVIKIILGIAIIWFTLGVSNLGDMIDCLVCQKSKNITLSSPRQNHSDISHGYRNNEQYSSAPPCDHFEFLQFFIIQ